MRISFLKIGFIIRRLLLLAVIYCRSYTAIAQEFNFYSITVENDFFFFQDLTDKFYTNGIRFESIGKRFNDKNYLLNRLLIRHSRKSEGVDIMYGSFFGQNMYTPNVISSPDIQINDRPFAGWLYFGAKSISTSSKRSNRITSELYLGIVGPYALAGETQTFIHKITNSTIPKGWPNQVDSDLGINYVFRYESLLGVLKPMWLQGFVSTNGGQYEYSKSFAEAIWFTEVNCGTVFDNVGIGGIVRIGYMNPYFSSYNFSSTQIPKFMAEITSSEKKRFGSFMKNFSQVFVFVRPQIRFVVYNAMLQGGLLNDQSPYVVSGGNVNQLFGQVDYGLGLNYRSFTLSYYQSIRTKEFSFSDNAPTWGGVNIVFAY